MSHELYKRYRPKKLSDVIGQDEAAAILQGKLDSGKVPHSILFTGPSGCGKTTLARILAAELGCDTKSSDFNEINAAKDRGIEVVRSVEEIMNLTPLGGGKVRVWLWDEAHQLVKKAGGDAQTSLLKMLEDTPEHVYFFLATTHPDQLLETIRNRCLRINVKPLEPKKVEKLLRNVAEKEKIELSDKVVQKIIDVSNGSARRALVHLDSIHHITDEKLRLNAIQHDGMERQAIDLCRVLFKSRVDWAEVAEVLNGLGEVADAEGLRYLVLQYARKAALGSVGTKAEKAIKIMEAFRCNYFDEKYHGLVLSSWNAINS